jgi:hypothetical protein
VLLFSRTSLQAGIGEYKGSDHNLLIRDKGFANKVKKPTESKEPAKTTQEGNIDI